MDHVENLHIDSQHEQQRRQDPAKEVKVDHVIHADDGLKLTGHHKIFSGHGAIFKEKLQVIPAKHWREAHYYGHQPTQQHGCPSSPRGHHSLVTVTKKKVRIVLR